AAQIQEIKNIIRSKSFIQNTNLGTIEELNLIDIYKKDILKSINLNKKIRLGVDCANTPIGLFAKDIMSDAGCEVYELYPEPNGDFPNHHPDPSVEENLKDLVSLVKREELDFGISFDGDADRIGVVDENGSFIYSDMVLLLLARSVLKDNPGAKIIGEVKCSKNLFEDIKKNGGIPIMWRTGHSNIKRKVKEESAPLAGELSGHIFFADKHHGFDDALYAGLRLAEVASYYDGTFSSMLKDIPQMYSTPEMRIDFPEEEKFKFIEQFTKSMKNSMSSSHRLVTVDGIRIETDDGWALVRASNTQPALTIRFEANSEKNLKELMQYVQKEISKVTDKICIF
ncbi:MAG: phosphomannomutase/phosphoglucomutase, partial [Thermodesulfobacteriota bacteirum]|nr:phosphomannomutase/phosphoglucomutase [Thermodesulfobacteriota bacterium]